MAHLISLNEGACRLLKFHRDILKEFEPIGNHSKVILFGSLAKAKYRLDSDIDLAIITEDENLMKASSSIADRILVKYGKVVSLKFIGKEDFAKNKNPLIEEIRRGKVIYHGRDH